MYEFWRCLSLYFYMHDFALLIISSESAYMHIYDLGWPYRLSYSYIRHCLCHNLPWTKMSIGFVSQFIYEWSSTAALYGHMYVHQLGPFIGHCCSIYLILISYALLSLICLYTAIMPQLYSPVDQYGSETCSIMAHVDPHICASLFCCMLIHIHMWACSVIWWQIYIGKPVLCFLICCSVYMQESVICWSIICEPCDVCTYISIYSSNCFCPCAWGCLFSTHTHTHIYMWLFSID